MEELIACTYAYKKREKYDRSLQTVVLFRLWFLSARICISGTSGNAVAVFIAAIVIIAVIIVIIIII